MPQLFGAFADHAPVHEVSKYLYSVMPTDYMGAAEFEFGALPESYQELAKMVNEGVEFAVAELGITSLPVLYHPVIQIAPIIPDDIGGPQSRKVWLLAPRTIMDRVQEFVFKYATNDRCRDDNLKEFPHMQYGIFGTVRTDDFETFRREGGRFSAWYDLNNHWFLTKSEKQLEVFKAAAGITNSILAKS
jgi:hypothetical protein